MRPWLQHRRRLAVLFMLIHQLVGSDSLRIISSRYAGPYRIKFIDIFRCNQSEPLIVDPIVHCNERNKTHDECSHVYGNVTVRRDFTGSKAHPASVTLNQWRDKEWKRDGILMKFTDGVKAFQDYLPEIYATILAGHPRPKKHVYTVDVPARINVAKFIPVFPYGRWKALVQCFEDKQGVSSIFCLNAFLDVLPK